MALAPEKAKPKGEENKAKQSTADHAHCLSNIQPDLPVSKVCCSIKIPIFHFSKRFASNK
jgi:hypothetical protein